MKSVLSHLAQILIAALGGLLFYALGVPGGWLSGSAVAGILWGLPEAKISTLVLDNVSIKAATGMVVYHATGVSFTNGSSVTPTSGAAVRTFDATVSGIATTPF